MHRIYRYIGPDNLRGLLSERRPIQQPQDIWDWISQTGQRPERGLAVATFIIDTRGQLWIADRHSEHVACAAGEPVLSAGEMTFALDEKPLSVVEVTNQSLGYCPEPSSWPAVAAALEPIGLPYPFYFTNAFTLRLCRICGTKNIVKDGVFECGVCQSGLPAEWKLLASIEPAK